MKYSPNQLKVINYLRAFKGFRSPSDIGEFGLWATGKAAGTMACKALKRLLHDGLVERNERGYYRAIG